MDAYLIISIAAFGAVTALVVAAHQMFRDTRGEPASRRLRALANGPLRHALRDQPQLLKENDAWASGSTIAGKLLSKLPRVADFIEQADVPFSPKAFAGLIAGSILLGSSCSILLKAPLPMVPVIAIGFAVLPVAWVARRRSQRFKRFARQLPDALDLLARGIRAGHSVQQAMHVVACEMLPPISTEFSRCCEANSLGAPLSQALDEFARRIPNPELQFFVTSVRMQQRMGGNLAEILNKISYIVRERFKILGQVKALTGEGRISGAILLALPPVLFGVVYYLSPEYVEPLFTEEIGRKMLMFAGGLQLVGAVAIKKIINIKV